MQSRGRLPRNPSKKKTYLWESLGVFHLRVTDTPVLRKGKKQSIMELVNIDKKPRTYYRCRILVKFPFEQFLSLGIKTIAVADLK